MSENIEILRVCSIKDTRDNWRTNNPVLLNGEVGYEIDTRLYKIGDGIHNWIDLPYYGANGIKVLAGENVYLDANTTMLAEEGATIIGDVRDRIFDETKNPPLQTGNLATAPYSIAMGRCTEAHGYYSTAMGSRSKASGHYSIAGGNGALAEGYDSVALGGLPAAKGKETVAIGN